MFAPVLPFGVENSLRSLSVVPKAVVLTPSAIMRFGDSYEKMYKLGPRPSTIFVNSGLGDTDRPPRFELAYSAAKRINASFILLPDVPHEESKTLKAAQKAMALMEDRPSTLHVIGVPQGKSYDEYINCANELVDMGVESLGVSRGIRDIDRFRAQYVMGFRSLGVPVHLLGFTNDMDEDMYCAKFPGVASISSAMPVWLGQKHKLLLNPWAHDASQFGKRPSTFFLSDAVTPELLANLFIVSSWVGDEIPLGR